MKKSVFLAVMISLSVMTASSAFAGAPVYEKGDTIVCGKECGGGGDVPFPFLEANQQFELADGSPYNLYGRIVIARAPDGSGAWIAYLQVDLKKHGWLLNDRRREDPRYPLIGPTRFWKQYDGAYVRLGGYAQGQLIWHEKGYAKHEVMLATSLFRIEKLPSWK